MTTLVAFAEYLVGFVPFLSMVAIALFAFWILTKMIPSLNAWMTAADVEDDTDVYYDEHRRANHSHDYYV